VDRETVGRYLQLRAKPAISITGKVAGRKSQREPLFEVISAKVEAGLSAQRIYQDLVVENCRSAGQRLLALFSIAGGLLSGVR
jgi:hypothetical protein